MSNVEGKRDGPATGVAAGDAGFADPENAGFGADARLGHCAADPADLALQVGQGSLYPALHRLEAKGWIASEWGASEAKRRARYYSLTRTGRKHLEEEKAEWERLSAAIALVLKEA